VKRGTNKKTLHSRWNLEGISLFCVETFNNRKNKGVNHEKNKSGN